MGIGMGPILTIVGLIITVCFSVIGVLQARKSGKLAKKANEIAKESLKEEKKEHLPLVQFADNIHYEEIPQKEAFTTLIFNFADILFMENVPVIKTTMENIGQEPILGLKITSFLLYAGDETMLQRCPDISDMFSYKEIECQNDFVLKPEEKKDIYFAIPDVDKEQVKEIVESEMCILSVEFDINSATKSDTKQKGLTATVVSGKVNKNELSSISLI